MDATRYLTLAEVVAIHDRILESFGAPYSPLLDSNKLDSALSRPRNAAHYEGSDLIGQAALLAVAIAIAHAFMDGNKRVAFASMKVFLTDNALEYGGGDMELALELERVIEAQGADRISAEGEFALWLKPRVQPYVDEDGTK